MNSMNHARPPGAPKRHLRVGGYERGEATRLKILEAAIQLFGEGGFEAPTTRMLAEAAGVSLPQLHYYFGGKEGLYTACWEHIANGVMERLEPPLSGLEAALSKTRHLSTEISSAMKALIYAVAAESGRQDESSWLRFLARERENPSKSTKALRYEFFDRMVDVLSRATSVLIGAPPDKPESLIRAMSIIGAIIFFNRNRDQALQILGWQQFSGDALAMLQAALWDHVKASLQGATKQSRMELVRPSIDGKGGLTNETR